VVPSAPGSSRTTASSTHSAAGSPPDSTKSPTDSSPAPKRPPPAGPLLVVPAQQSQAAGPREPYGVAVRNGRRVPTAHDGRPRLQVLHRLGKTAPSARRRAPDVLRSRLEAVEDLQTGPPIVLPCRHAAGRSLTATPYGSRGPAADSADAGTTRTWTSGCGRLGCGGAVGGDFVLSGGEPRRCACWMPVVRLLPGAARGPRVRGHRLALRRAALAAELYRPPSYRGWMCRRYC